MAIVGELDQEVDGQVDWTKKRADPLKHIVH